MRPISRDYGYMRALQALGNHRVDVLLSDIAMLGGDGYGLIRAIRAREGSAQSRVPAAALTSLARVDDRARVHAGFEAHFAKPIDARSLIEAVAALAQGVRTSQLLNSCEIVHANRSEGGQ